MLTHPAVMIAIAQERALELRRSAAQARTVLDSRGLSAGYRVRDGIWIRPRRESS